MRSLPLLLLLTGCAASVRARDDLPAFTEPRGTRFTVEIPARDGVPLHTVVHLPPGEGPWPVVLTRSPYPIDPILAVRCRLLNAYGYACVRQDTRGQGASGGDWDPFRTERDDGMATLDWIDQQPWSNDKVAMHGESYLAAVQWLLAPNPHPTLVTIIPAVFGTDLRDAAFEGGLIRHDLITAWATLMPTSGLRAFAGERYRRSLGHRPRRTSDLIFAGEPVPWYRLWLDGAEADSPVWTDPLAVSVGAIPSHTELPVLMIGGWGDAFLGPQLTTWARLRSQSSSALVLGPWNHIGGRVTEGQRPGLRDEDGAGGRASQWPRVLDWLGHHLKGEPLRYPTGVTTYPLWGEGWTHHAQWPPPSAARTLHLAPGDDPTACAGALTDAPAAGRTHWTYDPSDPTPSLGGPGLLAGILPGFSPVRPGFWSVPHRACADSDDLVGFQSPALPGPLHLAGPVTATLRVRVDVPNTGLMVRLLVLHDDGRRTLVAEGLSTLTEAAPGAVAGAWVDATLSTWPVEAVLHEGSRIGVELGSASFPRVEAHPNVAGSWVDATETRVARVELDLAATSVTVPVVQRD